MEQGGRLRLRPWLEEQIQSGRYPGVSWLDQSAQIFQIPWKHAARHGWSIDRDATLFRSWAMHTGRYRPGKDKPDPKTWKANFRCALNSLPDVCELHEHSRKRGNDASRVYRMLPSTQPHRRRRGFLRPAGGQVSLRDPAADTFSGWQPCSSRSASEPAQKEDPPSEDSLDQGPAHGDGRLCPPAGAWEAKPEEQEQNEAVFNILDQVGHAELWTQSGEQRGWKTHTLWDQWPCAGEGDPYPLHPDHNGDPFGPNYLRELTDWSTQQPTR